MCQLMLYWLKLFYQASQIGTQACLGMRSKFSIRRRDNHALGVTLGRYNIIG